MSNNMTKLDTVCPLCGKRLVIGLDYLPKLECDAYAMATSCNCELSDMDRGRLMVRVRQLRKQQEVGDAR